MNITALINNAKDFYENDAKRYGRNTVEYATYAASRAADAWENREKTWNSIAGKIDDNIISPLAHFRQSVLQENTWSNSHLQKFRAIQISGDQILDASSKAFALCSGYLSINTISSLFSKKLGLTVINVLAVGFTGISAIVLTQNRDEIAQLAPALGLGAALNMGRKYLQI